MEDVDFDLAFELYDRPKAKLTTTILPTPFTPPQPHTPHQTPVQAAPTNPLYRSTSSPGRNSHSVTHSGATFRSSFASAPTPKGPAITPLSISSGNPSLLTSGYRNFIVPNKPLHHRGGPNHVIQISSDPTPAKSPPRASSSSFATPSNQFSFEPFDDDDDVLTPVPGISKGFTSPGAKKTSARAVSIAKSTYTPGSAKTPSKRPAKDASNHTIVLENDEAEVPVACDKAALAFPPECDMDAAKTWQYPNNYERRDYQFSMVQSALFKNTLVCLPTGLGKTLIAAVVMYNFYRWFPKGKIIFMAPTKPLVAQQIEACRDIVSIPPEDSIAMTGKMNAETRSKHWTSKRIFFVTPQVPQNDIASGICPVEQISLLVFDEAHKAHGDFAYCDVIRGVAKATPYFRVLALSATPGSDLASIQDVLTNLLISKIELRTDDSPDVKPYLHSRFVDEVKVKLDGPIIEARERLRKIISLPITWLQANGALYRLKKGEFFTFTRLESARNDFRHNEAMQRKEEYFKGQIEARFAAAMSMYHGSHLITDYGLGPFKEWLNAQTMKPVLEKTSQYFTEMVSSKEWHSLSLFVNEGLGDPNAVRHPKLKHLESIVLDHFHDTKEAASTNTATSSSSTNQNAGEDTRVMIFVHFRDTVGEIVSMLQAHAPTIRPMVFIGQSKKGLSQKQQAEVVRKFREGHFNTLVSTSIGEEGLDIGEVDLIVCYDTQQSPIRMIQRMGRTGRKRNGRCVMLLTEGSEDISFKKSKAKGKAMIKAISGSSRFHFFNGVESGKLLPDGVRPTPEMRFMEKIAAAPEEPPTKAKRAASAKRTRTKKAAAAMELDEAEEAEAEEEGQHVQQRLTTENLEDLEVEDDSDDEDEDDSPVEEEVAAKEPDRIKSYSAVPYDDEEEDFEEALREIEHLRAKNASASSAPGAGITPSSALISSKMDEELPISSTPPPAVALAPTRPTQPSSPAKTLAPTFQPGRPATSMTPAPQHVPIQAPLTAPMVSSVFSASSSTSARPKPAINRAPSILDQSQSSLEPSSGSINIPLEEFPAGFFDIVQPTPYSVTSSSAIDIPPPPPAIMMPLDFDLGFMPGVPPSIFPPLSSLATPPKRATPPPLHDRFLVPSHPAPASASPSPAKDTMVFHTTTTATTTTPNATTSAQLSLKTQSPSPTKPATTTTTTTTTTAHLSTSPLLLDSLSSSKESPSPTRFKRLRKMTEEEDASSSAAGGSIMEEDSGPTKLPKHISPPAPKRQCLPGGRRRFLQDEAELDEDNSDGEDYSGDEAAEDIANSQDLAFIASEDSDISTTKMRSVYARSLAQDHSDGVGPMTWIDGTDLSAKFQRWNEYSDVESTSEVDSSRHTMDSVILDDEADQTTSRMQVQDQIVISSAESSPAPTPPAKVPLRLGLAKSSAPEMRPLGIVRPSALKLGLSQSRVQAPSLGSTSSQRLGLFQNATNLPQQQPIAAMTVTEASVAPKEQNESFGFGISDDDLLLIDVDNLRRN